MWCEQHGFGIVALSDCRYVGYVVVSIENYDDVISDSRIAGMMMPYFMSFAICGIELLDCRLSDFKCRRWCEQHGFGNVALSDCWYVGYVVVSIANYDVVMSDCRIAGIMMSCFMSFAICVIEFFLLSFVGFKTAGCVTSMVLEMLHCRIVGLRDMLSYPLTSMKL